MQESISNPSSIFERIKDFFIKNPEEFSKFVFKKNFLFEAPEDLSKLENYYIIHSDLYNGQKQNEEYKNHIRDSLQQFKEMCEKEEYVKTYWSIAGEIIKNMPEEKAEKLREKCAAIIAKKEKAIEKIEIEEKSDKEVDYEESEKEFSCEEFDIDDSGVKKQTTKNKNATFSSLSVTELLHKAKALFFNDKSTSQKVDNAEKHHNSL